MARLELRGLTPEGRAETAVPRMRRLAQGTPLIWRPRDRRQRGIRPPRWFPRGGWKRGLGDRQRNDYPHLRRSARDQFGDRRPRRQRWHDHNIAWVERRKWRRRLRCEFRQTRLRGSRVQHLNGEWSARWKRKPV